MTYDNHVDIVDVINYGVKSKCAIYRKYLDDGNIELKIEIGGTEIKINSSDAHRAFNLLRKQLGENYKFLCNGARRNFILSPMAREGGGFSGYLVEIGKPADIKNIVETFASAPLSTVGTLEEQENFWNKFYSQWD
jgi:hypothetical protein